MEILWLRRYESNIRPQGYEPCELPLLYSAEKWQWKMCLNLEETSEAMSLMMLARLHSANTLYMVPMGGLEPPTSGLWIPCSHQLSYIGRCFRCLGQWRHYMNSPFLSRYFFITVTPSSGKECCAGGVASRISRHCVSDHFPVPQSVFWNCSHTSPRSWYAKNADAWRSGNPPLWWYISQKNDFPSWSISAKLTSHRTIPPSASERSE